MKFLRKTTPAPKPRTKESRQISYAYAIVLIVLVLCQLFTFDKFLTLLQVFAFPGGDVTAHLVGSLIVISEVFALPFLLELNLSPLMRAVSMVFGWMVPLVWLILALWLIFATNSVTNIGLLGTVVAVIPGWWAVYISIALGTMAAWASWGLWPGKRN
jgi:hypothetical protein